MFNKFKDKIVSNINDKNEIISECIQNLSLIKKKGSKFSTYINSNILSNFSCTNANSQVSTGTFSQSLKTSNKNLSSFSDALNSHNSKIKSNYHDFQIKANSTNDAILNKVNKDLIENQKKNQNLRQQLNKDLYSEVPVLSSNATKIFGKYAKHKKVK
jgi:hypothetical protein